MPVRHDPSVPLQPSSLESPVADYYSQTVVQPSIPNACMTPLERWLLEQIFEFEPDDNDTTYFFAAEGANSMADAADDELEAILREDPSPLAAALREQLAKADDPDWLDLDRFGYAAVFQAIVARHPDQLPYVTVEMAFTCSKMRPDGFGGGAELITAEDVRSINTSRWLADAVAALAHASEAADAGA